MPDSAGYFITGTDTGVGKTVVTLGLMQHLQDLGYRVAAMKPVATGCVATPEGLRNDDAVRLRRQANVDLSYDEVNPYAFEEPVAPHIAAAAAGVRIEPGPVEARLARMQRVADRVCVEGVGGWLVPLAGRETVADLARRLGLDVVLVVGIRLGCLNHALLTLRAIEASGLRLAGWVANCLPPASTALEENIRSIETFSYAPLLGVVPPLCPVSVEGVAAALSSPARD